MARCRAFETVCIMDHGVGEPVGKLQTTVTLYLILVTCSLAQLLISMSLLFSLGTCSLVEFINKTVHHFSHCLLGHTSLLGMALPLV